MEILSVIPRIQARIRIFLRKHFVTWLYETPVGIKCSNSIIANVKYTKLEEKYLPSDQLFLGVDFLKDKFTLCGQSISDSPHYNLMKALDNNEPIKTTDYWRRIKNGTLDSRSKSNPIKKEVEYFYSQFKKRKDEVLSGQYEPISVFFFDDRYYIEDGKHRAALCAYLKKDVRCNIISSDCMLDSYRMWNFRCLMNKKDYSINTCFFERLVHEK